MLDVSYERLCKINRLEEFMFLSFFLFSQKINFRKEPCIYLCWCKLIIDPSLYHKFKSCNDVILEAYVVRSWDFSYKYSFSQPKRRGNFFRKIDRNYSWVMQIDTIAGTIQSHQWLWEHDHFWEYLELLVLHPRKIAQLNNLKGHGMRRILREEFVFHQRAKYKLP